MKKYLSTLLCAIFLLLFSLGGYAQPVFSNGHSQVLTVCQNSSIIPINTYLKVFDSHTGPLDTWSVVTAPAHGSLSAAYFTPATGGTLTPTGTTYGPTAGYAGADTFSVQVTDGTTSDTTTIYVTVNPLPDSGTITGPSAVCTGATAQLTDAATGGAWSSSNTSIATVSGGMVTGVSAGLDTISYAVTNTCGTAIATSTIMVNTSPAPITGNRSLCTGVPSAFSDTSSGGTWSSVPGTVSIGSASGIATGMSAGTATIFYTLSGLCTALTTATVYTTPGAISGSSTVCRGAQIVLIDGSGAWASSNTSIATVNPTVGLVTGINAGSATITFTTSGGCTATKTVTVNPASPITGPNTVCTGATTALSDTLSTGTWSSSNTTKATITSGGVVNGIAIGTTTITYTLPVTGCAVTKTETVNQSPPAITGFVYACIGATTTLTDATPGGAWSSGNTGIATVGSTGIVSGLVTGTAGITYTIPATGCIAAQPITVAPLPIVDTVTGGNGYCSGTSGAHVYLSGSTTSTNYFLHYGGSIAATVPGTGAPLDFGPQALIGTYTATATSTISHCSNAMFDSAVVYVIPTVIPTVTIATGIGMGDTVCAGAVTTFTVTPVNGGTTPVYQWTVNGTVVGLDTSFYTYGPASGDVVTATMISNAACAIPDTVADTMTIYLMAHQTPSVSFAPLPDTICMGTAVKLIPIPAFGGPSPSYTYIDNGTVVASGPSYTYVPANGDTVYCLMVSDYFCLATRSALNKQGIRVDTPIVPNLMIYGSPAILSAYGESDTLVASVTNTTTPLIYQWYVDTTLIPGATTNTYISNKFDSTGQDSVTCVVSTTGPCNNITTFNWTFISITEGVKKITGAGSDIHVLPNPNKGTFFIKGSLGTTSDEEVSLEITDMLGRALYTNKVTAHNGIINERVLLNNSLPNGMYLLNLRSDAVNKVFHIAVEQ